MGDKKINNATTDRLIIGFDCSDKDDMAALCVCRGKQDGYVILNTFTGQEALDVHNRLVMYSPNVKVI